MYSNASQESRVKVACIKGAQVLWADEQNDMTTYFISAKIPFRLVSSTTEIKLSAQISQTPPISYTRAQLRKISISANTDNNY